jgi:hypothetical protein
VDGFKCMFWLVHKWINHAEVLHGISRPSAQTLLIQTGFL